MKNIKKLLPLIVIAFFVCSVDFRFQAFFNGITDDATGLVNTAWGDDDKDKDSDKDKDWDKDKDKDKDGDKDSDKDKDDDSNDIGPGSRLQVRQY